MKQLIVGFPRSKSSYLQEALSQKYNALNVDDPYSFLHQEDTNFETNKDNILTTTEKVLAEKNIVVKIHSYNLLFSNGYKRFFPLKFYKLESYDKIYLSVRDNLVDLIASILISIHRKQWQYKEKPDDNFVFTFSPLIHHTSFTMVQKMIVNHNIIKNYLKEKEYTELYYEDIDNYVKHKLLIDKVSKHPTMFDYKKIVTNYGQMYDFVELVFGTTSLKEYHNRIYTN